MRRLDRTGILVIAIAMMAVLAGCSGEQQPDQQQVRTREEAAREERTARETQERTARETELKIRNAAIAEVRAAFESPAANWQDTLKGASGTKACSLLNSYRRMKTAMNTAASTKPMPIPIEPAWTEAYNKTAKNYASEMWRILQLNQDRRELMGNCVTEDGQTVALVDGGEIMMQITDALSLTSQSPPDIGTTPERLQARLLADYRTRLARLRRNVEGELSFENPGTQDYLDLLGQARDDWHFTPTQLGVSEDDIKFLNSNPG